jgi:hypothetical protein
VIYATGGYGVAKDTDASISWHKRAVALGWNETKERTYVVLHGHIHESRM